MSFSFETIFPLVQQEVASYQVPVVDLIAAQTHDPFKVLLATILSARTRDEVTAAATRRLFPRAGSVDELAELSVSELEKLIYPVGFYRNKARYLSALPKVLNERFDGKVPDTMDALLSLPGVGRKTANLVIAVAFDKPAICVDTHVHRIMNIWGMVATKTPLQTEMQLRKILPERYWKDINFTLVAFGQGTCKPVSPHCDRCPIEKWCPKIGVTPRVLKRSDRMTGNSKKFLSWNVNGLRAALKNGFSDVLHALDPDILALQEIKAHPDQVPEINEIIDGYHVYWNPAKKKGYAGTAVFSKVRPVRVWNGLDGVESTDDEGRVLNLEFADFYFINVYSPNAQPALKRLAYKQEFHNALLVHMNNLSRNKSLVLCGDLNVAHKEIDLANPGKNRHNPGFSDEERAWMDEISTAGYIDTFRKFDPSPGQYTWWSYRFNARAKNIGWRIDYFIVDPASDHRVLEAGIHDEVFGSDHCPVSIVFR